MKVTATQMGFWNHHIHEAGTKFQIPDKPSRKVTKDDDEATQKAAAGNKGEIPLAFASVWMRLGWTVAKPAEEEAPASADNESNESVI